MRMGIVKPGKNGAYVFRFCPMSLCWRIAFMSDNPLVSYKYQAVTEFQSFDEALRCWNSLPTP